MFVYALVCPYLEQVWRTCVESTGQPQMFFLGSAIVLLKTGSLMALEFAKCQGWPPPSMLGVQVYAAMPGYDTNINIFLNSYMKKWNLEVQIWMCYFVFPFSLPLAWNKVEIACKICLLSYLKACGSVSRWIQERRRNAPVFTISLFRWASDGGNKWLIGVLVNIILFYLNFSVSW